MIATSKSAVCPHLKVIEEDLALGA
jgi:hypothetical protein